VVVVVVAGPRLVAAGRVAAQTSSVVDRAVPAWRTPPTPSGVPHSSTLPPPLLLPRPRPLARADAHRRSLLLVPCRRQDGAGSEKGVGGM